jgi:Uncharacterized small protein
MSATLRSLDGQDEASILREVQSALRGLRFGAVEITVHNGQVVQIERKENSVCSRAPANPPEPSRTERTRLDHRSVAMTALPHRYCSSQPRMRG